MILKFVYAGPAKEEHCFECSAYKKEYNAQEGQYYFIITLKSGEEINYNPDPDDSITVYVMSDEGKTIDTIKI